MDGRLLALAAAACFALAAALQQRGELRLEAQGRPVKGVGDLPRLVSVPVWLGGSAILLAGYAVQGVALDVGKIVVVQPLLVTTLVFALPLGHWLTKQRVTRRQVGGAVIVVIGLGLFVSLGDPAEGVDTAPTWEVLVASVAVSAVAAALCLAGRGTEAEHKAALFGAAAGVLFGLSATFDKPAFSSADSIGDLLAEWELYALVGFGVVAFAIQQLSLATGRLAPAMAAVAVANPAASCLIGALVYAERLTPPDWHIALAILALLAAFGGAVIVTLAGRDAGER
jgi:drug/metabolite transporter (DMT)-like permease